MPNTSPQLGIGHTVCNPMQKLKQPCGTHVHLESNSNEVAADCFGTSTIVCRLSC